MADEMLRGVELVHHYADLGDVLGGAIIGMSVGWLIASIGVGFGKDGASRGQRSTTRAIGPGSGLTQWAKEMLVPLLQGEQEQLSG